MAVFCSPGHLLTAVPKQSTLAVTGRCGPTVQPMPHALEEGYQIGWLDTFVLFHQWSFLWLWSSQVIRMISMLQNICVIAWCNVYYCIMHLMLYEIGSKFCFIWIGPRSGFTDFQSLTFYNATFSNPGQCGDLLAETVDLDAVLRFPSEGDGPANPGGLGSILFVMLEAKWDSVVGHIISSTGLALEKLSCNVFDATVPILFISRSNKE